MVPRTWPLRRFLWITQHLVEARQPYHSRYFPSRPVRQLQGSKFFDVGIARLLVVIYLLDRGAVRMRVICTHFAWAWKVGWASGYCKQNGAAHFSHNMKRRCVWRVVKIASPRPPTKGNWTCSTWNATGSAVSERVLFEWVSWCTPMVKDPHQTQNRVLTPLFPKTAPKKSRQDARRRAAAG